jgi:hypothetical protein
MGVDLTKLAIVKSCLEASFKDVRLDIRNRRFVFHDGAHTSELVLNSALLGDLPEDALIAHMKRNIVPTLQANPGKKISVSTDGIGIGARESS